MSRSPSAARIAGDDYQHLFAWYQALRCLAPASDVTGIAVEAEDVGNVDDVVVRHERGPDEFYQVKYSVDAQHPIDRDWWITTSTPGGTSTLQKFWTSWQRLPRLKGVPRMGLYTNRPLNTTDAMLKLRESRDNRLMPALAEAKPGSEAGRGRKKWAEHLGSPEDDLLAMLEHLTIRTEQSLQGLIEATADRMAACGLRSDELAVEAGVAAIRRWVVKGRREIDRQEIVAEIERRELRSQEPARATLVVQAIDHHPSAEGATVSLDWVDLFMGDEARVRRHLRDPAHWGERLWPDLRDAERRIAHLGYHHVLVRGHMRLSVGFAVGVTFADTRGYGLRCIQGGEPWDTSVARVPVDVRISQEEIGQGPELAVALGVSHDIQSDVSRYLHAARLPVRRLVHVAQPDQRLPGAAHAMSWAWQVREIIRTEVRETGASRLRLFLATPLGAALFLGHLWNRVPTTQVYEDMNPCYAPSFLIP